MIALFSTIRAVALTSDVAVYAVLSRHLLTSTEARKQRSLMMIFSSQIDKVYG